MEILELQIFTNKQWLIGFIIISIVGSISRIMYNWKHTPKDVDFKSTLFYVFFGLVVCFFGEIFLKAFEFQKYRIFLMVASFFSENLLGKLVKNEENIIDKMFKKSEKFTNNEK